MCDKMALKVIDQPLFSIASFNLLLVLLNHSS